MAQLLWQQRHMCCPSLRVPGASTAHLPCEGEVRIVAQHKVVCNPAQGVLYVGCLRCRRIALGQRSTEVFSRPESVPHKLCKLQCR